jgi:hypothetical protein
VNPKKVTESSQLTATVNDAEGAGSGVDSGEYFIGTTDPGEGHGTPLALVDGTLTLTVGTDLHAGTYTFNVRAKDMLGTWSTVKTADLVVARPVAPTNLTAASPTNHDPVLTWSASPDAVSYAVYRNGVKLAEVPTGTSYTDANRPDGTYSYTVTAINGLGDQSDPSDPRGVLVDKTAPTADPLTWTTNPITASHTTTLTAATNDTGTPPSGVTGGEYFLGPDPGVGNGTPMTLTGGTLTATFGANLAVGTYPVGVRARDAAGNWSNVSPGQLTVQSPLNVRAIGSGSRNSSTNNSLAAALTGPAAVGDTVVVAVATGTFAGPVGCTDPKNNSYHLVADKNTGNGRLFLCSAAVTTALTAGDTISATYPGFSGLSMASVTAITGPTNPGNVAAASTSSGSGTTVNSGAITPPAAPAVIFGVLVNNGTATFTPSSQYTTLGAVSAGTGSGKKTITPVYAIATTAAPYDLTGTLSGSGFWQSAITAYLATS